jgi:hypothetical protein
MPAISIISSSDCKWFRKKVEAGQVLERNRQKSAVIADGRIVGESGRKGNAAFCAPDQGYLTRPAWEVPRLPDKPPRPITSKK